jgi:hypothetical protein
MRRLAVRIAAIVLVASGTAAAVSSPASAGLCNWYWQDKDPGSAQVIHPVSGFSGIAMRDGPRSDCSLITRVPWGHWVALDCFVHGGQNINGITTWSHVRYSNGGPVYWGWISDYYLSGLGSNYNCA